MLPNPLPNSSFNLDMSGVVGFIGGAEAVKAMMSIYFYPRRRWLGWYNSPGAPHLARWLRQLPLSTAWRGLFSGSKKSPEVLFEFAGKEGPSFRSISSGTRIDHTGQFGHLLLNKCKRTPVDVFITGREITRTNVAIASVTSDGNAARNFTAPVQESPYVLVELIPVIGSVGPCVICAIIGDLFSFITILLGIVSHGITALVLGAGILRIKHLATADGSPKGDGLLMRENDFVIVLGSENAVNVITRGSFALELESAPDYNWVGLCALLLISQFIVQILLVPQGTLFGQVMFLASLAVSWGFNSYIASEEWDDVQTDMVFPAGGSRVDTKFEISSMNKYSLPNRTAVAAFIFYVLQPNEPRDRSMELLEYVVPNETHVWTEWRNSVANGIFAINGVDINKFDINGVDINGFDINGVRFSTADLSLLTMLLKDAQQGRRAYCAYITDEPARPMAAPPTYVYIVTAHLPPDSGFETEFLPTDSWIGNESPWHFSVYPNVTSGIVMFRNQNPQEAFAVILGVHDGHPWMDIVTNFGNESAASIHDSYDDGRRPKRLGEHRMLTQAPFSTQADHTVSTNMCKVGCLRSAELMTMDINVQLSCIDEGLI